MNRDIEKAVRDGVRDALTTLGVDSTHPFDTQRDMKFLRDWRMGTETIRARGMMVLVGLLVAGLAGALWAGIKLAITK